MLHFSGIDFGKRYLKWLCHAEVPYQAIICKLKADLLACISAYISAHNNSFMACILVKYNCDTPGLFLTVSNELSLSDEITKGVK